MQKCVVCTPPSSTFSHLLQLLLNELYTNESEMDLNYQQLRLRLSFACVG